MITCSCLQGQTLDHGKPNRQVLFCESLGRFLGFPICKTLIFIHCMLFHLNFFQRIKTETEFQFGKMNIWEMDNGESCTIMWMYSVPLNCTVKYGYNSMFHIKWLFSSVQSLSRVRLCSPMDGSTPGFPVLHQLPELVQTQVHRVSDAIQPPHPLWSPSPPAFDLSQHQGLFHQVAKVWEFQLQHQSFQWIFKTDFL